MKTVDDQELITIYLTGDNKAFEILLLRHKNRIFRFILMKIKVRDLADDIFQETFVKIINTLQLGKYNEEGKFLPWAMRIAHNLVIDHFRKTSKVRMISESSSFSDDYSIFNILSTGEENTLETMTRTELENQMVDLIEHLPETQREIIQMRIFQDLSFKDIAEMENISINTALGRMRYALMNLRKLIDKHQLVIDIA
jgi:RNA polymerase sigma-70 factor (ECF subfamily)